MIDLNNTVIWLHLNNMLTSHMQKFSGWLSAGLEQGQGPCLGGATSPDAGASALPLPASVTQPHVASLPAPSRLLRWICPGLWTRQPLDPASVIPWMEAQAEPKGDSFSLSPTWFRSKLIISSQACMRSWKTARKTQVWIAKPSVEEEWWGEVAHQPRHHGSLLARKTRRLKAGYPGSGWDQDFLSTWFQNGAPCDWRGCWVIHRMRLWPGNSGMLVHKSSCLTLKFSPGCLQCWSCQMWTSARPTHLQLSL